MIYIFFLLFFFLQKIGLDILQELFSEATAANIKLFSGKNKLIQGIVLLKFLPSMLSLVFNLTFRALWANLAVDKWMIFS